MVVKEKVWLLSTKDIEFLYKKESGFKKILINTDNSISYPIDDSVHQVSSETLSFINFYSDYLNKYNCYDNFSNYQKNKPKKIQIIEDIQKKLQEDFEENQHWENSSIYFDKIFRLKKNKNVKGYIFLARCFPNKFKYFKINNIERSDYWLLCYMQTVANILEKKIEEIDFYGLLHKGDILNNIDNGTQYSIKTNKFWNGQTQNITLFRYSHDNNDIIYTDIICNSDFFNDLKEDDNEHLFMLARLTFNGVVQRKKILNDIGTKEDITNEDIQFLLNCSALDVGKMKDKFKLLWNIGVEEFIKNSK